MKKVLFTALTLPLIFAACSNEDFETQQNSDNNNGDLIELDANFALGINKGTPDTRAEYETSTGKLLFEWMPEVSDANVLTPDRVGLCWTGQTPDGKAYTNYEFTHFAWAKKNATPDVDPCGNYKWKNLVFLSEAEKEAMGATGRDNGNEHVSEWKPFTVSSNAEAVKGSGYFKTCNMTIFKGDYLLYTPFNETFYESDNLVAVSNKAFNVTASTTPANAFKGIANEIFCVGTATIKGGKTANGFSLSPLSGMIRVRLEKDAAATKVWQNIKKVAIYSAANGGIITQQAIDGRKVNAAKAAGNMAQCLVEGDIRERSTSLFATAETAFEIIETSKTDIIIPALPQTITDAQVVIFDEDGKSAMIDVDDIVVKSNNLANVEIKLTDANALQTDVFYVVDMETFASAMHQSYAKTDGANVKVTVKLLNDIIYNITKTDDSTNGLVYVNKNMTIEGGKIIIPNDNKLTIELQANKTLTVKSNIEIQGKNCCGNKVGDVIVYGSGSNNTSKYVFDGQIDNYGSFQIGATSSVTNAEFNGKVNNLDGADDAENNEGKEKITICNKTNAVFKGDVVNEGSFATNRQYNTVGNYTTVNNFRNEGEVIVAKLTTLTVAEGATLTNNGFLTVDTNNGTDQSLDGTIDNQGTIINNKVVSNKGVINTYGSLSNQNAGAEIYDYVGCQFGGNKAVVPAETEYICDVDNSKVTSGNRLAYALDSKMPTTTVRFVKGSASDAEHKYDLKNYKDYAKLATVKYIIDTENGGAENPIGNFQLSNSSDAEITFGTSVVMEKARNLKFMSGKIKVNGPITVKAGFMMNESGASVAVEGDVTMIGAASELAVKPVKNAAAATEKTEPNWTVNGNVILNATSSKLNVTQKAAFDLNGTLTINKGNTAFFGYSSYTDVEDDIAIDGTFTRELSSGTATANPAKVWCESFTKGSNAVITNGLPETR